MAGDPVGALLFLGMGVDTLSMSAARLPRVKSMIRRFPQFRGRALVETVRGMQDGFAIRRLLDGALQEAAFDLDS